MAHEALYEELERLGVAEVRARLVSNVYLRDGAIVRSWLERKSEAASAEQLALARLAATDAATANSVATRALRIAAASMIITAVGIPLGIIVPHYWH